MSDTRVITTDFTWHRPASLEEALDLLAGREGALALAGGTDLLIRIKTGGQRPRALVHLMGIEELGRLEWGTGAVIGAAVRLHRLLEDGGPAVGGAPYAALFQAVRGLGSVQIRNMATLAGNLCNASPSADTATPLMVLGAEVEIAGRESPGNGRRNPVRRQRLAIESFFTGPGRTVLEKGELVTAVFLPKLPPGCGSAFRKIGRVTLDMAKISASVFVRREGREIADIRVAVGGAAPRPVRAPGVEESLRGRPFDPDRLRSAVERVGESLSPISDVRSSAEYRREMAPRLVRDAFLEAWERAGEERKGEA